MSVRDAALVLRWFDGYRQAAATLGYVAAPEDRVSRPDSTSPAPMREARGWAASCRVALPHGLNKPAPPDGVTRLGTCHRVASGGWPRE